MSDSTPPQLLRGTEVTSNPALIFLVTGPKLKLFRGPGQKCLFATKDTLITKAIPRDWKVLLQDRGQRPNTIHITSLSTKALR